MVAASDYLLCSPLVRALKVRGQLLSGARLAGVLLVSALFVGRVSAGEVRAHMAVTAIVVDSVGIRALHQMRRLVITAQDVERGYVEVPAGSRLDLRHKGPCLFEFRPVADIFRAVTVAGLTAPTEFHAEGGTAVHRCSGDTTSIAISYRFQLRPGVSAGIYPWPLLLTVLPM